MNSADRLRELSQQATGAPWKQDAEYFVGGDGLPEFRPGGEVIGRCRSTIGVTWEQRAYPEVQQRRNTALIVTLRNSVEEIAALIDAAQTLIAGRVAAELEGRFMRVNTGDMHLLNAALAALEACLGEEVSE